MDRSAPRFRRFSRRRVIQLAGAGIIAQGEAVAETPRGTAARPLFSIDPARAAGEISPLLFGHNLEHTRRAVWQGVSAEMLANRKFAGASTTDRRAATAQHGFYGQLRTQGAPGSDGVAAHWYGIGNSWTTFYVDDEVPYAGRTSQRLDVSKESRGGLGQSGIQLLAKTEYQLRVVLRTHFGMKARVRVCDRTGRQTYFQEDSTWTGNEWHTWEGSFTAPKTDPQARLEITFEGIGTAWLGAASMLPAENFRGLRKDVIALLKEVSTPVLRWPGGNFTRNWIWKDGLLPVDRRPPVLSKSHETLPFSDNWDFQEIGIDDFLALCQELGAAPSLVLNLTDELQNACDLLEYCNGSPDSTWGKVRSARGRPAPYGVKFWSLGNENFGFWMGPGYFPPEEYGRQAKRFATALRKIDPTIELVGCGGTGGYTEQMVKVAGKELSLVSAHHYHATPEADSAAGVADLEHGRKATVVLRETIEGYRAQIAKGSAAGARKLPVSLDEWNIWHWWFIRPEEHEWHSGPMDGMYVASALNLFCREGPSLDLHSAMFFQPINEGCIAVQPHSAKLTAAGQVFRFFRAHHGNRLIDTGRPRGDEDLDLCASLDRKRNCVVVTLLNRNSTRSLPARLQLSQRAVGAVEAKVLSPVDSRDVDSVLEEKPVRVRQAGSSLDLEALPYSATRVVIGLR